MTENKQITIYDLLPLLKGGWVAMDKDNEWYWYEAEPYVKNQWIWGLRDDEKDFVELHSMFNIAPFDGDWKDSLMEIKG